MARILYFDPRKLGGHRVEYLHHFYEAALLDTSNEYIILTGNNFKEISKNFNWKISGNIMVVLADNKYLDDISIPLWKMAWNRCVYLRKMIRKYNIDKVFFVNIVNQMPFLPFFVPNNIKTKGIVYNIPYYLTKQSLLKKIRNYIIYFLYAKCKQIETLYLLNADNAILYYNNYFNTRKFKFLPDPFVGGKYKEINIRKLYGIDNDKIVFAQFGYLSKNKGCCEILETFLYLPQKDKENIVLILAGEIEMSIQQNFFNLLSKARKSGAVIYIKQGFVSFDYIYSLCKYSNFILLPYKNTAQSSGMFGYASNLGIPLVAPNSGLIGEVINKYKLGFCLNDISTKGLLDFMGRYSRTKMYVSDLYAKNHTLEQFQKEIIKWEND